MKTAGKVIDAVVIVGAVGIGISSALNIVSGIKSKKGAVIGIGVFTLLISGYALREAVRKIND